MSNCCSMCGSSIPSGQNVCSMCYGDPYYGRDGYYLKYLEEQAYLDAEMESAQREEMRAMEAQVEAQINQERRDSSISQ